VLTEKIIPHYFDRFKPLNGWFRFKTFMVFNLPMKEWFFIGYWILKKGPISIGLCVFPGYKANVRPSLRGKLTDKRIFSQ